MPREVRFTITGGDSTSGTSVIRDARPPPTRPLLHLYIHVPFCRRRCSYCDFAIAVRSRVPVDDYLTGLDQEIRIRDILEGRPGIETLYLGGGTPSRLGAGGIDSILASLASRADMAPGAEITLEANPEDVTTEAARAWRNAGVTRVSLGVQTFDEAVLRWMHRTHGVDDVHRAANALTSAGFENWSLDLIYALPEAHGRSWSNDLKQAIELAPSHISAYGLTFERGSPIFRWLSRGETTEAGEDLYAGEFLSAHHDLGAAGYEHYEVSSFALPGRRSRHNSSYWTGAPYAGVGPSAHGFDGLVRRWNLRAYTAWLAAVRSGTDPVGGRESLSAEQQELERLYLGLRTWQGVAARASDEVLLTGWVEAGWGILREGRIVLTALGWLRLDALVAALTVHRSR
ncbi:MAG: radical SAM family heme chaperone HemW [Gemmatimonadota bacterium]